MAASSIVAFSPDAKGDECSTHVITQTHSASGGREELPPVLTGGEHSQLVGTTGSPPAASLDGPIEVPGLALASQIIGFETIQNIGLEANQSSQASYETSDRVTQNPETDRLCLYIYTSTFIYIHLYHTCCMHASCCMMYCMYVAC